MFTPLELEKIEFGSAVMGGYKRQDVEDVFNELTADYETLYKENIALKDKIQMLDSLVDKYKNMEDALQNALLLAQTSSDAAIRAAQEKAQNIVKEAEDRANYIKREAEESVQSLVQRELDLKRNISVIATRNISQLRTQIEILNGMVVQEAGDTVNTFVPSAKPQTEPKAVMPEAAPIPEVSPMEATRISSPLVKNAEENE